MGSLNSFPTLSTKAGARNRNRSSGILGYVHVIEAHSDLLAGAAQSLGAGAILVNPWNITDMAQVRAVCWLLAWCLASCIEVCSTNPNFLLLLFLVIPRVFVLSSTNVQSSVKPCAKPDCCAFEVCLPHGLLTSSISSSCL